VLGLFRRWKKKSPAEVDKPDQPDQAPAAAKPAPPPTHSRADAIAVPLPPSSARPPRVHRPVARIDDRPSTGPFAERDVTIRRPTPPPGAPGEPAPLVIPRPEHNLSRKKISPNALKVMRRLIARGFRAYLVGGCVRDIMIGQRPKDYDVVTNAHPEEVRVLFRNCRLIGRRFRLAHVFFQGGEIIEVSTFRQGVTFDVESDGPLREENSYGTPASDALRRDLTINGLFYDLENFAIYDYVGGMKDLRDRAIRIIGEPGLRIREDPIRMIRAIRHAARTGFVIEPVTRAAIAEYAGEITKANPSRLRDEFLRELRDGQAAKSIALMLEIGLLRRIVPSTCAAIDGDDEPARRVRAHMLANLAALDEAQVRGEIPLPVVLAAFVGPLTPAFEPAPAAPDRPRHTAQQTVRECVKPMLHEIGIGRGDAEATAMLLLGQRTIVRVLSKGTRMPGSLVHKSYFVNALLLYQIETQARGEKPARNLAQVAQSRGVLLFGAGEGERPRRRRRGGRKRHPAGPTAPPAGDNGKKQPAAAQSAASPVDPSLVFNAESRELVKTTEEP
jgi:poly(A) polymerase